ncbi:probable cytochrome P450 6a13 [Diabrotica virgifera virgifera]|uniref:Cytochrome P450 6a14 n=1 Tax=Diabrotica virgifera virgifera TaxID=50390 RepID=A0ABM5ICW5_DIAVI|nr:probable cytochrome P450 6a13 [Diabrotica virgifera virgifera]
MSLLTNNNVIDLIVLLATIVFLGSAYVKYCYAYWKRNKVVQLTPQFPFGNYGTKLPRGISIGAITKNFYDEFRKKGLKFGGVYFGLDPYLVIVDPTYAKDILTKDFQYFIDRGIYFSKKSPITVHLLTQEGSEWREARAKFTNIFTSAKMRFFFETVKKCSEDLKSSLKEFVDQDKDVDIFEIVACYTTDIIGDVVYGIQAQSFSKEGAIFRQMGRELFNVFSKFFQFRILMTICYPKISKMLGFVNIQGHIEEFFMKFLKEALDYREANKVSRSDFLQLLIEMKNSGVELTDDEMAAQAFLFFTAGFETSSMSSSFILFELGLHQDVQDKVREEIITVLKKHDDKISYDVLKEMKLLDQAFNETARKYPVLTTLNRVCTKDYKLEDSDFVIKKGTPVLIPLLGYTRDPEYYPDPLKWDINRFQDKNEKHIGYFPFGDGPRNCIGSRFGLMQVKLALVSVLRNFKVFVSPNTKIPLEFDEQTFVTKTTERMLLRLKSI